MRHLREDPRHFISTVEHLVSEMSKIQKCHLVLISLLPSLENNHICGKTFVEANEGMKALVTKYGEKNVTFLNVSKTFMYRGQVDRTMYRDGVHMNPKGSAAYAKCIRSHLKKLPNRYFE